MFYQIINIDECLTDDIHFLVRGFDSEESFIEGKTNPRDGAVYIRFEKSYKYPKELYDASKPLRGQIYDWLNIELGGEIINDAVA
ncbi:hypothetical protein NVP1223O_42 [Vibrio phage 1.223.O._10N.261.48.A9]|nr:hypothetical protein NVP1223O_42 [Vibrio phage 1.223.O._10N.261.48.A9]